MKSVDVDNDSENNVLTKTYLFSPEIIPFEQKIIRFFEETMSFQGYGSIEAHIIDYLFVRNQLTEKQIYEISKVYYNFHQKNGISTGSISTCLNDKFLSIGLIQKVKDQDIKKQFLYSVDQSLLLHSEIQRYLLNDELLKIFQEFQQQFQQISPKTEEESFIFNKLNLLINQIINVFQSIETILAPILEEYNETEVFKTLKTKTSVTFSSKFPPNLEKNQSVVDWEDSFFYALERTHFFDFEKESYNKIIMIFLKYRQLTQDDIKKYTNLSAGHISQALSRLMDVGFIRLAQEKLNFKNLYVNNSLEYLPIYSIFNLISKYNRWKVEFKKDLAFLTENSNEWKNLMGYHEIISTLKRILNNEFINEKIEKNANDLFGMNNQLAFMILRKVKNS